RLRSMRAIKGGDDVPAPLETFAASMLAKNAKDRPTANDVVTALEPYFQDRPRALVDAVLGPPTRQQVAPLETQVVRVLPTDDTVLAVDDPATLPATLPPTLPPRPLVIT